MDLTKTIINTLKEEAKEIKITSVACPETEIEGGQKLLGTAREDSIQLLGLVQILDEQVNILQQDLEECTEKNKRINIEENLVITDRLQTIAHIIFSTSLRKEFIEKLNPNENLGVAKNFQVYSYKVSPTKIAPSYNKISVKDAIAIVNNQQ